MSTDSPKNIIPLQNLKLDGSVNGLSCSEEILPGTIDGLTIFHRVFTAKGDYPLALQKNCAVFLIILKGNGLIISDYDEQLLDMESLVVLPNGTESVVIKMDEGDSLHLLEFTKAYSEEDIVQLKSSGKSSMGFYFARFQDCKPYTEKIKSPNTISRTVLPSDIIPRVALGTVECMGPDKVGKHSHPMLEQLFLGLEKNAVIVHADNAKCEMGEYSLLHIPLGSTHWVEVSEGCRMNYMWMDFFLTKAGEVWLDTHKPIDESARDSTAP